MLASGERNVELLGASALPEIEEDLTESRSTQRIGKRSGITILPNRSSGNQFLQGVGRSGRRGLNTPSEPATEVGPCPAVIE